MSSVPSQPSYPICLSSDQITRYLPHRGEALFAQQIEIHRNNRFNGIARWSAHSKLLEGHFPNFPVVPGVMVIEALAQLAGVGLLVADPATQALKGQRLGVLASIRKATFKRPILPDVDVFYQIECRHMSDNAVNVSSEVLLAPEQPHSLEKAINVAKLDVLMISTEFHKMLVT